MAGKKTKAQSAPRLFVYGAYRFQGQDPLIGEAVKFLDDPKAVEEKGGAKRGTVTSWKRKKNRASRTDTLNASLRTRGKKLAIVDV